MEVYRSDTRVVARTGENMGADRPRGDEAGRERYVETILRRISLMILLKSNERFDEILKLDPDTGFAEVGSRDDAHARNPFLGHFARIAGGYVCIYRRDG